MTGTDEAIRMLEASPDLTCAKGTVWPTSGIDPGHGQTEWLSCDRMYFVGNQHRWHLMVRFFQSLYFAERMYRQDCRVIASDSSYGWIIWEPGQEWLAEVDDSQIVIPMIRPVPRAVAEAVASALGSSAWSDCGAVRAST